MSCCKETSFCLSFAAKCWRCFTNALMTLRHYAFSRLHRTQISEGVYAFVLWRYVAVQIWIVKELFAPGIVASTIKYNIICISVHAGCIRRWGVVSDGVTYHTADSDGGPGSLVPWQLSPDLAPDHTLPSQLSQVMKIHLTMINHQSSSKHLISLSSKSHAFQNCCLKLH